MVLEQKKVLEGQGCRRVMIEKDVTVPREWATDAIGHGPWTGLGRSSVSSTPATLADELALMRTVDKFPWPLEIIEDEPTEAQR
ncbi:MAG: hypothetical protein JOY55_15520 [Mycobacterium sp.]|nr:hypothetical protein [Mycobacterium sp.]